MTRDDYLELMKAKVKNVNLQKHMLAAEAILRDLAVFLGKEEVEAYGLAGLLHDIDYEDTVKNPKAHGLEGAAYLQEYALPEYVIDAIRSHSGLVERKTELDKALYAVDPLTGLIVASALVHPDRKLVSIDTQFIMKRFGEKAFARGAKREQIATCSELGLELEEFIFIGLKAMTKIAEELGL